MLVNVNTIAGRKRQFKQVNGVSRFAQKSTNSDAKRQTNHASSGNMQLYAGVLESTGFGVTYAPVR